MQLGASPEDGANSAVPLSIHYLTLLPVQAHALSAGRELGKRHHRTYVMLGKTGDVRSMRARSAAAGTAASGRARTHADVVPLDAVTSLCVAPPYVCASTEWYGTGIRHGYTSVPRSKKKKEDLSTVTNDQNAIDPSLHGVCCIKY